MSRLRVGLVSDTLNARHCPTALVRANYLAAAASRIDSLWVFETETVTRNLRSDSQL
jgi:hypothetical protein